MTRQSSEGGHLWPFGEGGRTGKSKGTYNLLDKRPTYSNQYGELYEADSNDWRQLGDLDVKVSLANISSVCFFYYYIYMYVYVLSSYSQIVQTIPN